MTADTRKTDMITPSTDFCEMTDVAVPAFLRSRNLRPRGKSPAPVAESRAVHHVADADGYIFAVSCKARTRFTYPRILVP